MRYDDIAVAQSLDKSAVPYSPTGPDNIEPFQRLPISGPEIDEAYRVMLQYQQDKANLEQRLVDNDRWYKLRQWEILRAKTKGSNANTQVEPTSAWLFNAIANKHADAMDNFPAAVILPREAGDKQEAKTLSAVIPVVLDQCGFEQTYSDVQDSKLESGTGVYGVFWDPTKLHGLGDIDISCVDLINLFWEPGITDIQKSRNIFYVSLQDNDILEQEYPQLAGKLGNPVYDINKYVYDDTIDVNGKSAVVDWYYKKRGEGGKTILHYCKFVAGTNDPLFATENVPQYAETGLYDHGQYPFVFDRLYHCKGTPTGFGLIDVAKSVQEFIDRGDKAILENVLFNARPRHFIRNDGSVNETEFSDTTKDFVHVDGNLGVDSIMPIQATPLNPVYVQTIAGKVDELKEITGNRDVQTGGTTGGVTAASAIAAMQEAGSRLSRDSNKGSYRAYKQVVLLCIELVRQFYGTPRCFRITGAAGQEDFRIYSNAGLVPQPQGQLVNGVPMEMGIEVGYRLPLFDAKVAAEKQSPYSRVAQNELALQFYSAGFFAPENATAALACLDMMDFEGKDDVMSKISANGTLFQMLQQTQALCIQLAQQLDAEHGTALAQEMAQGFGLAAQGQPGQAPVKPGQALGNTGKGGESSVTSRARAKAADNAKPR